MQMRGRKEMEGKGVGLPATKVVYSNSTLIKYIMQNKALKLDGALLKISLGAFLPVKGWAKKQVRK